MQILSSQSRGHKSATVIKAGIIFLSLLVICLTTQAQAVLPPQTESNSFTPADSSFVMQVSRVNNEVLIGLSFSDSLVFEYADIERRVDFSSEFSRCKYITYGELKTNGRHLIKKDMYPYAGSNDVLYRLKIVTKDGAERIFPSIDLPAVKK